MVQRVRKNKRRLTKMEEQSQYSGLVFCADCGSNMVLHRAHTMSASYNHFTCRTYKRDGEACTGTTSGSAFWMRSYWRTCAG